MLKGIIISSALIGGYSVAEEMIHPDAYVAKAASCWNAEKSKKLDEFMNQWASTMGQNYSEGNYQTGWGESINEVNGYYIDGYPLAFSSTGSQSNVMNVVARYYRTDGPIPTMYRYIFTICNGTPRVYYTANCQGGMGNDIYAPTANKALQDGFARIVHSSIGEKSKPKPSKTYSYKGMLTAKKSDYSLFANKSFSEKKGYTKAGRTYYAKGYFNYDGKRYYSLYQKDSKGQTVWRGYADSRALTEVKSSKVNKKVMMTGKSYTRWQDLYFSRKLGTAKKSQVYYAKQAYTVGNGKTYYTLYQDNKAGKSQFKGYVDSKGLTNLNGFKVNKQFVVKKGTYNCWDNLYFSKSKGKSSKYVGKIVTVKYGYKLNNGKTYYSLYDGDKWLGYIEKPALVNVTQKKVDQKMIMKGKKYTLWRNLAFSSKKGYATKGQTYQAKRLYTLEDGKKYYSLYKSTSNGKWEWKGYVDSRGLALVESK